jgi:hypothetical protein
MHYERIFVTRTIKNNKTASVLREFVMTIFPAEKLRTGREKKVLSFTRNSRAPYECPERKNVTGGCDTTTSVFVSINNN